MMPGRCVVREFRIAARKLIQMSQGGFKEARSEGRVIVQIADNLKKNGVPTAKGGAQWYASNVKRVLDRNTHNEPGPNI